MEILNVILAIVITGVGFYYFYFRKMYYLKKLNVPYQTPIPLFGNMAPSFLRRTSIFELLQSYYDRYSNLKYFGFFDFMTPTIIVRDPEIFTLISIKNFDYFMDHRSVVDSNIDPLMGKNLFNLQGDTWREMRKLVSPTFTLSKMKIMFELVRDCAENCANHFLEISKTGKEFEMREMLRRYTNDVVASCAFGVSINSMKDPGNEFYKLAARSMNLEGALSTRMFLIRSFPILSSWFGMKVFDDSIRNFFNGIVSDTVKMREEKGISRPDMIQLMMEGKKSGTMNLTIDDMTAQAFVFFLAGFEASSTLLAFLIYEMALNPEIQNTMRQEIDDVMNETDNRPNYESVMGMKYLDAVVNETLRLYPLVSFLDRLCLKEFEIPPATSDGKPTLIKPGTSVWFLPYSVHRDSKYYPNPDKFDPDRFLDNKVNQSTYVPFGLGPRICIGNRFALMQSKIMIFYFFAHCEVEPCSRTKIPINFSRKSLLMTSKDGFWLKVRSRK